jgi:transposase
VTQGIDLSTLSHAEKDDLILSLVGQLEAALARIAELEKRLAAFERPAKTPDNSSLPPSRGQKPDRPHRPQAAAQGSSRIRTDASPESGSRVRR